MTNFPPVEVVSLGASKMLNSKKNQALFVLNCRFKLFKHNDLGKMALDYFCCQQYCMIRRFFSKIYLEGKGSFERVYNFFLLIENVDLKKWTNINLGPTHLT